MADAFDSAPIDVSSDVKRFGAKPTNPKLGERPVSLLQDPKAWWASLSDDEKQAVLDNIGEFAGGTLGAAAGGGTPMSIPGAGAGAVAGVSGARLVGRAMGLKPTPRTAKEEALDLAKVGAVNAAGEGVGRAVAGGLSELAARGARKLVNPNPDKIKALAAAGVTEPTPGMLTDSQVPKVIERGLAMTPGGNSVIRDATTQAAQQAQGNLERQIAGLGPKMTDQEVGRALQSSRDANIAKAREQFAKRYSKITQQAQQIDATAMPYNQAARDVRSALARDKVSLPDSTRDLLRRASSAGVPKAEVQAVLSPEAQAYLEQADQVAQSLGGGSYLTLPENNQQFIDAALAKGGVQKPPLEPVATRVESKEKPLTVGELINLRTQLLEQRRMIRDTSTSLDKRSFSALVKGIDDSIEQSLTNAGRDDLLSAWRDTNTAYSKFRQQYFPSPNPQTPQAGNAAAGVIRNAKEPERAISTGTQSAVQGTEMAVNPKALRRTGLRNIAEDIDNPMPALRRNRGERLLEDSRTLNPYLGDDRYVNPQRLEKLYGENPGMQELLRPVDRPFTTGLDAAKAVASPMRLDNTSRTAMYNHYLNLGKDIGTATVGALAGAATGENPEEKFERGTLGAIAAYGLPKMAAKGWTSQTLRNALTSPAQPVLNLNGGIVSGALGRMVAGKAATPRKLKSPEDQTAQPDAFETAPMDAFDTAPIR